MKKLLIKVIFGVIIMLTVGFFCAMVADSKPEYTDPPANTISFAEITESTEEDIIEVCARYTTIVQGKKNNGNGRKIAKLPSEMIDEMIFNEEGAIFIQEETTTTVPEETTVTECAATVPPIVETQPTVIETVPETEPITETEPPTIIETVVETTPALTTAAPQPTTPIYVVNDPAVPGGAVMAEDLQIYLYQRLAERGIDWFMPYAIGIAYQESRFNIYAENKNGLDKGLFQYRITYYPGTNIFDPYEQIRIFSDQMANRLNGGCSTEVAISRHMMSDYGAYNPNYVQTILGWVALTTRIR